MYLPEKEFEEMQNNALFLNDKVKRWKIHRKDTGVEIAKTVCKKHLAAQQKHLSFFDPRGRQNSKTNRKNANKHYLIVSRSNRKTCNNASCVAIR